MPLVSLRPAFSQHLSRSARNAAFPLLTLVALAGIADGVGGVVGIPYSAARAQSASVPPLVPPLKPLTVTRRKGEQLTFTLNDKTCTILADKILAHKKGTTLHSLNKGFPLVATDIPLYSLKGKFRIVNTNGNTNGWEFFGKDAEIGLVSDDPVRKTITLITIYPRNGLKWLRPVRDKAGIVRREEREVVKPGTHMGFSFYLNANSAPMRPVR